MPAKAGMVADRVAGIAAAVMAPEVPAAVEPVMVGTPAAQAAGRKPGTRPEAGYRPWALLAGRRPGIGRSDRCPGGSSRCWRADRGSSAEAAWPAEDRVAGIGRGSLSAQAGMAAGWAVGIEAARRRADPAAAPAGPSSWVRTGPPEADMPVVMAARQRSEGPAPGAPAAVALEKADKGTMAVEGQEGPEAVSPLVRPVGTRPSMAGPGAMTEPGERCRRRNGPWRSRIPCRNCR